MPVVAAHLKRMDDGHATLITMENVPDIKLFEKQVTPPSITGGGPIDTTTMRNEAVRTMSPKQLKSLGQMKSTVAYASSALDDIYEQLNVNQRITITYPDGSRYRFWAYLDSFTPSSHSEGEQPTAELVFQPTNHDTNDVERAPEYHAPSDSTSTQ